MMSIHADILRHLKTRRAIGGKHVAYDGIRRGFPSHLGKTVRETADDLIREGYILKKPTSYGLQVSLNPDRLAEIDVIIEKHP